MLWLTNDDYLKKKNYGFKSKNKQIAGSFVVSRFGLILVSWFNDISTFLVYLTPKLYLFKDSSDTI